MPRFNVDPTDERRDRVASMTEEEGGQSQATTNQSLCFKRLHRRRFLGLSAVGLVGAVSGGLLNACGGSSSPSDDPASTSESGVEPTEVTSGDGAGSDDELADEQLLRIPWPTVDTLDVMVTQQYTSTLTRLLYDPLVYYDRAESALQPVVATKWEVAEDLKSYTFYLRDDARWTDGTPVTAGDYAYAIIRVLDPNTGASGPGAWYFIEGAAAFNAGESTDPASVGIRAVDDYTLEVRQAEPVVWTLSNFERADALPAPRWVIDQHGDRWTEPEHTVSNGRWKLESWRLDQDITMVRNEDYWGEKPTIERIVFNIAVGKSDASAIAAYETNEVDITWVGTADLDRIESDPDLSQQLIRHRYPQNQVDFIIFNCGKEGSPVSSREVRRALYLAIDFDRYYNEVCRGLAFPTGGGIIPEGILGHNPDAAPKGGVEEARRLLAEAGYPDGRGFPGFTLRTSMDVGTYGIDAQVFQEMWKQNLGIDVQVELMEGTAFRSWRNSQADPNADFDAFFTGTGGFDPTIWHVNALALYGGPRWHNAEFEDLIAQASKERDPQRRHELHAQADAIFMEDMPLLPYRVAGRAILVKPWVRNLTEFPQAAPRPLMGNIFIARH